ncbi:MAG: nucleotidyl transferase AbiEii/AbiGii toxin family protein [Verrucomicrobia bacterium]|nr:nucleotidyl transferase AbiEii/AbiGii toxin family protein [Verrucomicrobiota bacterium]
MNALEDVLAAAAELQGFCESQHWRFCFIGGVAVQRWGSPRFTVDVDLTLLTGFGREEGFVDALLRRFAGRRPDAREFALQRRVLLARTAGGVDLDIALGAFPFEERSIQRASAWRLSEALSLMTCSAEDLVVHKAFAGRHRDWSDVETVLIRQHGKLDLLLIRSELAPLLELKGEPESLETLERMISDVEGRLRSV